MTDERKDTFENGFTVEHTRIQTISITLEPDKIVVLTPMERFKKVVRQIMDAIKQTIQICCVIMTSVYLLLSLATLSLGVMLCSRFFEESTIVYMEQFKRYGSYIIGISLFHVLILCPLGLFGSLKKRKRCLFWFNTFLIISLLVHLSATYYCFKYQQMKNAKKRIEEFSNEMNRTYDACYLPDNCKDTTSPAECICELANIKPVKKIQWKFSGDVKDLNGCKSRNSCLLFTDYLGRFEAFIDRAKLVLMFCLLIQIITLFWTFLITFTLSYPDLSDDIDSPPILEREKEIKKKMGMFKKILLLFLSKTILKWTFSILFILGLRELLGHVGKITVTVPMSVDGNSPIITLCLAILQILTIPLTEKEKKRLKQKYAKRRGLSKKIYKAKYRIYRICMFALLAILLSFSLIIVKLAMKDFMLETDMGTVDLVDLVMNFIQQLSPKSFWIYLTGGGEMIKNDKN